VPLDGLPSDVAGTCLDYDEFKSQLATSLPARALLIVDACRNLSGGKDAGSSGFGAGKGLVGPQFAELLSCRPKEESKVGKGADFAESVFTHFLLAGLNGDAEAQDDGVVTFDSLQEYVQGKVSQYVTNKYGEAQNPEGRASLGKMVLVKPQRANIAGKQDPVPPAVNPEHPQIKPDKGRRGVARAPKINGADGAEMVYVPGSAFSMGDPDQTDNPVHKVTLRGYYIYNTVVTVGQYETFCNATGRQMPPEPDNSRGSHFNPGWQKKDHPIVNESWDDAQAYCKWAGVRLPTEAEWEMAARGTDGRRFPWGNTFDESNLWSSKAEGGDAAGTAPVGSFPSGASPCGALDMAGNVWQWCSDFYDADFTKKANLTNPTGPRSGTTHTLRGGSWIGVNPDYFRVSNRRPNLPTVRAEDNGFRCVSEEQGV
jgi:sulfatase modifying factor 1